MARSVSLFVAALVGLSTLVGCQTGPCRTLRHPELAGQPEAAAAASAATANTSVKTDAKSTGGATQESTVLVYKADGSLQCKAAKGLSVDEMEKQLAPIKVFSRDKRDDGLMHIQVCGSQTGQINVYEIPVSSQKDAEARGFKKFDHR
ncbi:MAG: hypothetical protein AAB250_01835 [Bdellovibrionota bacterium]